MPTVTAKTVKKMKLLRLEGWSWRRIGEKFRMTGRRAQYHVDPKFREKTIKRIKDTPSYQKRHSYYSEYYRNYMRERYKNDSEFRERMKASTRKSDAKRHKEIKRMRKLYPEYDEMVKEYGRERNYDAKKAWQKHKQKIEKLRDETGINFLLGL